MRNYKIKLIELKDLVVNIENPRFNTVSDQDEAIEVMIKNQNDKILNLAKDILENGLNPADLIIVAKGGDKYNVLEGNRRITALKILENPSLLDKVDEKMKEKIIGFLKDNKSNVIKKVNCAIFDKEEEAYRWINLKHTGPNKGIGTIEWEREAKLRFDRKQKGKKAEILQVIDFIKNSDSFNSDTKNKLNKIAVSNFERLILDPHVRGVLGIEIEDKIVKTTYPDEEIAKGLSKVIDDLSDKKIKVGDIYTKEKRLDYISRAFNDDNLPQKDKQNEEKRVLDNTDKKDDEEFDELINKKEMNNFDKINEEENNKQKERRGRDKNFSHERKHLIPSRFILKINNPRINNIYKELKTLEVEHFINSAAILFRVFIELSLDEFIDKVKSDKVNINSKLNQKLSWVLNYLKEEKLLTKNEARPIDKAISSPTSILAINTFNGYVHNKNMYPSPKELKISWDNLERFIYVLWENI